MPTLKELRAQIDKLDASIIKKLAIRKQLALKIGKLKMQLGQDIVDKKREKTLFEFYNKLSKELKLDPFFIRKLFSMIIIHSRRLQK